MKNQRIVLALVIVFILGSLFGFNLGQNKLPSEVLVKDLINKTEGQPKDVDFGLFWDVWNELQSSYLEKNNLNAKNLTYGATKGLVQSLDDPNSNFLNPKETQNFLTSLSGTFEGIGAEIGVKDKQIVVVAPLKGTPADKAGLMPKDKILQIDEKNTEGLSLDEAVSLIRGPRGTIVRLKIDRENFKEPKIFEIKRALIKIPVLEWKVIEPDIAYIQLFNFNENTPREFQKTARDILKTNTKKIILDLRNNPGGVLQSAIEVASWFLSQDAIVAQEENADGKIIKHTSIGYAKLKDFEIVVLINEGSASASEILAGALKDSKGSKIVGQTSFGKGTVQAFKSFERDNSSLKITVARWLTPSGLNINGKGIKPDFEIKLTEDDTKQNKDPQLDKAIELLKE